MITYLQLRENLIEEHYHPYWPSVLEAISEDDYNTLAYKYWENLSDEQKAHWFVDEDFREIILILMHGVSHYDVDDTMWASHVFLEKLKDFFIDEICTDLENTYFGYEVNALYEADDRAYEMQKYKELV